MQWWLLFVIVGSLCAIGLGLFVGKKESPSKYSETFKKEVENLGKQFSRENQVRIDEERKKVEQSLKEYINNCEIQRQNSLAALQKAQDNLHASEEHYKLRMKELEEQIVQSVNEKSKNEALQLQGVVDFYESRRQEIYTDFEAYQEKAKARREELEKVLKREEAKQQEIIEQYKRAEQIKQDKNFYRIVLSEEVQEDVKKLRKIAGELHDPTIIYKLIYKTYYEKPFTEMVGRVVSNEAAACGIYKITNLENGRSYIGQTRQAFKERWRTHLKRGVKAEPGTQNKLYAAMWEDGAENFTFEVLATCTADELNEKERDYIALYHADTWGYNGTGGNS